jgi:hypothetical protein
VNVSHKREEHGVTSTSLTNDNNCNSEVIMSSHGYLVYVSDARVHFNFVLGDHTFF